MNTPTTSEQALVKKMHMALGALERAFAEACPEPEGAEEGRGLAQEKKEEPDISGPLAGIRRQFFAALSLRDKGIGPLTEDMDQKIATLFEDMHSKDIRKSAGLLREAVVALITARRLNIAEPQHKLLGDEIVRQSMGMGQAYQIHLRVNGDRNMSVAARLNAVLSCAQQFFPIASSEHYQGIQQVKERVQQLSQGSDIRELGKI